MLLSVKLGLWLGSISGGVAVYGCVQSLVEPSPGVSAWLVLDLVSFAGAGAYFEFWRRHWDWSLGVSALGGLGDLGNVMQVSALFS